MTLTELADYISAPSHYTTLRPKNVNKQKYKRHLMYMYRDLYKECHGCIDCGSRENLTFDHVRGIKKNEVSRMIQQSFRAFIEELLKCEVRCVTCHRKIERSRGR